MTPHRFRPLASAACAILCAAPLFSAESVDVTPPKQRETVVSAAAKVLAEQTSPVVLPSPLPNPFIGRDLAETPAPAGGPGATGPAVAQTLSGGDLLARLAAQISATGTVNLGGAPILLLGQKRLKVGDTYTISFEGQVYELSIAAITPTSFTVQRGELTHTRPIRLSVSSTNTPTIRP